MILMAILIILQHCLNSYTSYNLQQPLPGAVAFILIDVVIYPVNIE